MHTVVPDAVWVRGENDGCGGALAGGVKDRAGACALAPPVDDPDDSDAMAQNANERRCDHRPGDDR